MPTTTPKTVPAGVLNVAVPSLLNEDWVLRNLVEERRFVDPMADQLVRTDLATYEAIPALAESWDIKVRPDGQTDWVFKLRRGVQFHKGWGEVTAEDMREAILSFGNPNSLSPNVKFIWSDWLNKDPSRIETPDLYTLAVRSPGAISILLDQILSDFAAATWVYPKKYMDQVGEEGFRKSPVFSGPFEFKEHVRGVRLNLRALTEHWRVVPQFAELNFVVAPETATAIAMVRVGSADVASIATRYKPEVEAAGLRLVRSRSGGEDFLSFGGMYYAVSRQGFGENDPWVGSFDIKDPMGGEKAFKVRQALNLAVERQAILDKIVLGEGYLNAVVFNFLREGAPWWNPTWKPYPYDPQRAKALLAEAGYPNGFDITMYLIKEQPRGADVGEAIASMWEKNLSLRVKRVLTEYRPTVRNKMVERSTSGTAWMFSQSSVTDPVKYACAVGGPSSAVVLYFEHPAFETICPKALVEMDATKRAALVRELGDVLYRNYPNVPLVSVDILFIVGPKVKEWQPRPRQDHLSRLEYATRAK